MLGSIPERILPFLNRLKEKGFSAYLVGGCVRDFILGKEPNDYDITTNATVEEIIRVFNSYHILNKHRVKHNTVYVKKHGEQVDITAFRCEEDYTISGDLKMRDFTINAIAYDQDFIDPLNGLNDIKNKVIKACDLEMFLEDPLRILRAIRFASKLGFTIEEDTRNLIKTNYIKLSKINIQRINKELSLALEGEHITNIMMEFWDVFCFLIPELNSTIKYNEQLEELDFFLYKQLAKRIGEVPRDYILRTAILILTAVNCHYFKYQEQTKSMVIERYNICSEILKKFNYEVTVRDEILFLIKNLDSKLYTREDVVKILSKSPSGSLESCFRLIEFKKALNRKVSNYEYLLECINGITEKEIFGISKLKLTVPDLMGFQIDIITAEKIRYEMIDLILENKLINDKKQMLKYIKKNLIQQYIQGM